MLDTSHVVLVWETVAACRNVRVSSIVPCYAYDSQRQLFDLGDLVGINYHIPITNSESFISCYRFIFFRILCLIHFVHIIGKMKEVLVKNIKILNY